MNQSSNTMPHWFSASVERGKCSSGMLSCNSRKNYTVYTVYFHSAYKSYSSSIGS